jgi:hypothetical protein
MARAIHQLKESATHAPKQVPDIDDDLVFDCNADLPAAIPEGLYEVSFIRAQRKFLWKREKAFLHFIVQELGPSNGTRLFMACNIPQKGRWAMSSKYWRMWILASGRRPARADRLSTAVFRNKLFIARVRTVRITSKQMELTPEAQYSVIDELIEVAAGV